MHSHATVKQNETEAQAARTRFDALKAEFPRALAYLPWLDTISPAENLRRIEEDARHLFTEE